VPDANVTILQNQLKARTILEILEGGDISTEMGSDICQVVIYFFGQVGIGEYETESWEEEDLYSQRLRVIEGTVQQYHVTLGVLLRDCCPC
jgi:hypothetical protein